MSDKTIELQFRAKMPTEKGLFWDDGYFYQQDQHLTSFFRRVLRFWRVSHPTYLEKELEDLLQVKIKGEWVQCKPPVS